MRREAEPWWRQAEADFEAARELARSGRHFAVCWFCHQAVEKGLKALYFEIMGREAPYTHDVEHLGNRVGIPPNLAIPLMALNPLGAAARYPDHASHMAPVDRLRAAHRQAALGAAEQVIRWLGQRLNVR